MLQKNKNLFAYLAILISVLFGFNATYGLEVLWPENINWLLSIYHDWGQHYLGWAYFRAEPWTFPLGEINNINYPAGTNVGYMDAIPLLALLLKPFSSLLSDDFQYLGFYLLTSHLLVAYYSFKLFRLFRLPLFFTVIACIMVAINPLLLYRGIHPATTAHWLILASLYYYFLSVKSTSARRLNYKQLLLLLIAALINPYLFVLIIGFNFILPIKHYFYDKQLSLKEALFFPILSILSVLLAWFSLGMISFNNAVSMKVADSYGLYGLNLNAFFNSSGFSRYLSALENYTVFQYEGFSFLGVGGIVLLIIASITVLFNLLLKKKLFRWNKKWNPLALLTLALSLFAITHQVTFGKSLLFEIPIPDLLIKLGNVFRASGRFIWLLYYILFMGSIVILYKIPIPKFISLILFIGILSFQLYDQQVWFHRYNFTYGTFSPEKLDDKKWETLFSNFDKAITYPPHLNNLLYASDYQDLCFLSLKASIPISTGYVARETTADNIAFKKELDSLIAIGELNPKEVIITTQDHLNKFSRLIKQARAQVSFLNGYYLVCSTEQPFQLNILHTKEEQANIDSVLNIVIPKEKDLASFITTPTMLEGVIKKNIEGFNYVNNSLEINGWAFLQDQVDNSGDSLFILFFNKDRCIKYPVKTLLRKDVTSYFKAVNLDNSGFTLSMYTDKFPPGKYKVAIAIQHSGELLAEEIGDEGEIVVD